MDKKFPKKPELKNYLNIHEFLRDTYNFRKLMDQNFSYEVWSEELDINHKSFLRQVVLGRRSITELTAKTICNRMNFSNSDKDYFMLMVQYAKTRSSELRNVYEKKLRDLLESKYQQSEVSQYREFLSDSKLPLLLTLISFTDIDKSLSGLTKILRYPESEIYESLRTLERLELVEKVIGPHQQEVWNGKINSHKVSDNIGDQAILNYHSQCLKEAIAAQGLPIDERRYRSLMMPLNAEEFAEFLKDLDQFAKATLLKFDKKQLDDRKLFRFNLNLHSVSEGNMGLND